jgi:hypothetical protein
VWLNDGTSPHGLPDLMCIPDGLAAMLYSLPWCFTK